MPPKPQNTFCSGREETGLFPRSVRGRFLVLDQESIDLAELPGRISAYKANEKFPRVVISGDEKARFGTTVRVLDELRRADITKFTVETKTKPTGE